MKDIIVYMNWIFNSWIFHQQVNFLLLITIFMIEYWYTETENLIMKKKRRVRFCNWIKKIPTCINFENFNKNMFDWQNLMRGVTNTVDFTLLNRKSLLNMCRCEHIFWKKISVHLFLFLVICCTMFLLLEIGREREGKESVSERFGMKNGEFECMGGDHLQLKNWQEQFLLRYLKQWILKVTLTINLNFWKHILLYK